MASAILSIRMKRTKTMKQIAEELGVSRTTVSLVLQGKGEEYRISTDTQKMIQEYVKQKEYRPNYFAKALNKGSTKLIGAVFPDVFESFMGNIIRGIESVLYPQDYSLMISTSRFDSQREQGLIEKMLYQGVEGIILVPTMPFSGDGQRQEYRYLKRLIDSNYPLVTVDRKIPGLETNCVLQNDKEAAYEATVGALGAGIEHLTCVSFDLEASSIQQRIAGYREACEDRGVVPETILLEKIDPDSDDLFEAIRSQTSCGGYLVTTSGLAEKLSWVLRKLGRKEEIIRFGRSSAWQTGSWMELAHPHQQMGGEAARLITSLLETPAEDHRRIICPFTAHCRSDSPTNSRS